MFLGNGQSMTDHDTCNLCGSRLRSGRLKQVFPDAERIFCCHGCLNVYSILRESGIVASGVDLRDTDLFRQSIRLGLIARPENGIGEGTIPAIPETAETREALFHVTGMWCASCAWLIEKALCSQPGVRSAEVFFASDLVRVRYHPQYLPPGKIEQKVAALGYHCSEYSGQRDLEARERRDLLLRIGLAAFIWMNVMYFSMVFYVGYFEYVADSARRYVPFVLMALSAPAVFYSGWPILRIAFLGLKEWSIRMETLLALGILSAWIYSSIQAMLNGPHYYFDTACAIVTLVLAGKLIERGARESTARAVSLLYRMLPQKARVMDGGVERFLSVAELAPGMIFTVKAGEGVPADGVVLEGKSHVDESVLTGESAPVLKEAGVHVICGSTNGGGLLQVRVTRTGEDTTLSQIIRMVEKAMSTRSELERQADRIARGFVPAVIGVAIITFAGALWFEGMGAALMRAITVLVVACPCALGIATPLAVTAAVGKASRRGILVSDTRFLETVGRVDLLVLDKTGTATVGQFKLADSALVEAEKSVAGEKIGSEILILIASLERYSEHPLGCALVNHARAQSLDLLQAENVRTEGGRGLCGSVAGRHVFVGSRAFAEERSAVPPACLDSTTDSWALQGLTVSWFGWDGAIRGALAFGDRIRPSARDAVSVLKRQGMRIWLVSGDTPLATAHVAAAIGADEYRAGCLPGDKEQIIRELRGAGKIVAMVGDGVNDAPALAQADLGIAMGTGTDIAMKAAPVTLMSQDLRRIPETFSLARATVRIIRQNLFWAFLYNAAGISLAVAGLLNPIAAAAAMVLSSVSVILNSLRVRTCGNLQDARPSMI